MFTISGATAQREALIVPFDAAIYSIFAMPYSDPLRQSETLSFNEGIKQLKMNFPAPQHEGFKRLGVWSNGKNSDERYITTSPQVTIIYTLDSPGAPTPSSKTAAMVYQITRVNLTEGQIQKNLKDFVDSASAGVRKVAFKKGTVYAHCQPWFFDYPALSKQIKTTCQSLYLTKDVYVRTSTVNLPLEASLRATMALVNSMR